MTDSAAPNPPELGNRLHARHAENALGPDESLVALAQAKPEPVPCPACRYDVRGLTGNICPECGSRFVLVRVQPRDGKGVRVDARVFIPGLAIAFFLFWFWEGRSLAVEILVGVWPTLFAAIWLLFPNKTWRPGCFAVCVAPFALVRPHTYSPAPSAPLWAYASLLLVIFLVRFLFSRVSTWSGRAAFLLVGLPPTVVAGHLLLRSTHFFTDGHFWSEWNADKPSPAGYFLPYGTLPYFFLGAFCFGIVAMTLCAVLSSRRGSAATASPPDEADLAKMAAHRLPDP